MIGLKELAKKKMAKPPTEKVNCSKSRVVFVGCISIFYNDRGHIFIPHAKKVLANHVKHDSNLKDKNYS